MKSSSNLSKNWFSGLFAAFPILVLVFSCASARAQILFDNGPGDPGAVAGAQGLFADTGYSYGLYAAGDVFTPTASGTANSISFAGFYDNNPNPMTQPGDSFTIYLYSVTPGTMGSPDAPNVEISQSTLTDESSSLIATSSDGIPIYQFSGNLTTPFTLNTSTEYYIGISDTTSPYAEFSLDSTLGFAGPATDDWQLATVGSAAYNYDIANSPGDNPNGQTYASDSLAFTLKANTVPEPSIWAMLLGGLGLLVFWRTRLARV